jgi:hypothetical protein
MKTQTMLTLFVILGAAGPLASGQTGAGAKYGSRDPFVCKSKKEPLKGAPSPSQIRDYVKCSSEHLVGSMGPKLYLLENVQAEVGKPRLFQASDINFPDIDNSQPLYPIRGSYDWYVCHANEVGFPPGRNCNIYREPSSTGVCYKTTFGDWNCTMADRTAVSRGPELQPVAPPK